MSDPILTYQVGGSLSPAFPGYVERQADQELLDHLRERHYCFVFNSRQMGKSSLRVRTMERLEMEGIRCAEINPQVRGTTLNEEQWYAGTIKRLIDDLNLTDQVDFRSWWRERQSQTLTPVERFYEFIDQILLPAIEKPLVIFVEEVDNLLSLEFNTNGFFSLIRTLHEQRTTKPAYARLTFCFLGVATPYDLIRGEGGSAFNIGEAVDMAGFTRQEATPLLAGLRGRVAEPEAALEAVLHWSGGQPFLTQKLLALLLQSPQGNQPTASWVEQVVQKAVIDNWEAQDTPPHLRTIRDRLLAGGEQGRGRLLGLYQQVLSAADGVPMEDTPQHRQLRLTGLVTLRQGSLQLANPLYAKVFDGPWVERELAEMRPTIYGEALRKWKEASTEDKSRHLIGEAPLAEAEDWARGKLLSKEDQDFLQACRDARSKAWLAKEEIVRITEEKEQAERDALRRRRWLMGLGGTLFAMGIASAMAFQNQRQALLREQVAQVLLKMESTPVEALIQAIGLPTSAQGGYTEASGGANLLMQATDGVAEINRLLGHTGWVNSVAFSPDDSVIASASEDGTIRLWDSTTGKTIGPPRKHGSGVSSVAFSPDGTRLVSGSYDSTLQIWDATSGEPIGSPMKGHQYGVSAVAFSPDGRRIASAAIDGTIRLWDANTGDPLGNPLTGHSGWVLALAFDATGDRLVSGSDDKTVRLWDANTGQSIGPPLEGHDGAVTSVAFDKDGQKIASGSTDRSIRVWDVTSAKSAKLLRIIKGHRSTVRAVTFNPTGIWILSGSNDGSLRLWDVDTGDPVGNAFQGHKGDVLAVAFNKSGTRIVSGSEDKTVRLWDVISGKFNWSKIDPGDVSSVAFSPDGKTIVSGGENGTLRILDSRSINPIGNSLEGHIARVTQATFSPDGRRIASAAIDGTIRFWDASSGKPIGSPIRQDSVVNSVAFSPDGTRLVSGSADSTLQIWDASTGQPIGPPIKGHTQAVNKVAFSPDGQLIASASADHTIRLWDAATGTQSGEPLVGHTHHVTSVAFSRDGKRLVSASYDSTLRLWDVVSRQPIGTPLRGHSDGVYAAVFSPDGRRIASASEDNTLRLWDATSRHPLGPLLQGHIDMVLSVAFSPDGEHLVSGSADNTVLLWPATAVDYPDLACHRLKQHQLLRMPERYSSDQDLKEMAHKADTYCSRQLDKQASVKATSQERTGWLPDVLKPLARLNASLRHRLGHPGWTGSRHG